MEQDKHQTRRMPTREPVDIRTEEILARKWCKGAIALALGVMLTACDSSSDNPLPPDSPPKPEVMTQNDLSSGMRNAVYSYSGRQQFPLYRERTDARPAPPLTT